MPDFICIAFEVGSFQMTAMARHSPSNLLVLQDAPSAVDPLRAARTDHLVAKTA